MRRGLCFSLLGLALIGALGTLAGCGRSFLFMEEREPWRHEAEVQCLKSGAVKEGPALVRISPIEGPGMCGADFPLKVAALGDSPAMAFADDIRPPGSIPKAGASQPRWPISQPSPQPAEIYAPAAIYSEPMAPPSAYPAPRASDAYQPPPGAENYLRAPEPQRYGAPPRYPAAAAAPGEPLSLRAPGIADLIEGYPPGRPDSSVVRSYPPDRPAYNPPPSRPAERAVYSPPPSYPAAPPALSAPKTLPALGPVRSPSFTGSIRPVEVKPSEA